MKKIIITLALIISTTVAFGQKNPFEKFMDMNGVTSVYISKNMLSLLPKGSTANYGGVEVGDFIGKLSSIIILTSEDKKIGQDMISIANNQVKGQNYELLMKVKSEDNQMVNFFMKGKPENIQELIMTVDGNGEESVIMQFLGNFTLQDVQKMTGGFQKDK